MHCTEPFHLPLTSQNRALNWTHFTRTLVGLFLSIIHHKRASNDSGAVPPSFPDRPTALWGDHPQTKRVLYRGGRVFLQHVLRRIPGLHHSLSDLLVRWDTLREGTLDVGRRPQLTWPSPLPLLAVLTEGLQVHCITERENLQSQRLADNRSHVPGPAGYRDLDTGSARSDVTATFPVHRRVFHVKKNVFSVLSEGDWWGGDWPKYGGNRWVVGWSVGRRGATTGFICSADPPEISSFHPPHNT